MSCAADGCEADGTKRCGRCGTVAYCSSDCQRRHWPIHKVGCRPTAGFCCPRTIEALEEARRREAGDSAPDLERELGKARQGASEVDLSSNELSGAAVRQLAEALSSAPKVQHLKLEESPWCLVGNGGMGYGDYYWGLYRDYYVWGSIPPGGVSARR